MGSKVKIIFSEGSQIHIKLMGMEHRAPYKHIFCPYTHPRRLGWGQKAKTFLFTKLSCCISNIRPLGQADIEIVHISLDLIIIKLSTEIACTQGKLRGWINGIYVL